MTADIQIRQRCDGLLPLLGHDSEIGATERFIPAAFAICRSRLISAGPVEAPDKPAGDGLHVVAQVLAYCLERGIVN
jgi:hypothetical protein